MLIILQSVIFSVFSLCVYIDHSPWQNFDISLLCIKSPKYNEFCVVYSTIGLDMVIIDLLNRKSCVNFIFMIMKNSM